MAIIPNFYEHELYWFFNEAEAEMGHQSTFSSFLFFVQRGSSPNSYCYSDPESEVTDFVINAASKYRRIENKYRKLSKRQREVLQLYFTYTNNAARYPILNHVFDDVLNVLALDNSKDVLEKTMKKKVASLNLKNKARKEVQKCLTAYHNLS